MRSFWQLILGWLTKLLVGVAVALLFWLPFYWLLDASIIPWLCVGPVVGVFLIFAWENVNPFRLRRLF